MKDQEEAIFHAAREQSSPEDRGRYLHEACGDDAPLRERIGALLAADDHPVSYLNGPVVATLDRPDAGDAFAIELGTQIGPYTLHEQIGEGGFGVVYVAEQTHPVARKVALKIIKPGMDTKEVIARFEAERQALAMMDHPNIAKVLDAGSTGESGKGDRSNLCAAPSGPSRQIGPVPFSAGRPYFAMELVRGVPITEFCDDERLPARERLTLFVDVCRAVQHAHQKGIIHRDLKPSNVMVTMRDDRPIAKVIDFGIAKALSTKLTDKTVYTAYGQMLGTPLYMSPEQAQMNELDVDTRSDIYSLGVLLYELLTGSTPFDSQTLKDAGYDEMRRIIREDEPPKPSARISTLAAEALSTVSEKRRHDPRRLSQSLRGELDWIVLRAMEKDRTRRYDSASDLAADIERYLADEPVEACPPTWSYRTRKLVRRHKVALTTTVLVAAALLIGTGVSAWQAVEANRSRQIADDSAAREKDAREDADAQRQSAEDQKKRAEQNLQTAMDAMDEMYHLATGWLASDTEATDTQRRFLDQAEKFYQAVAANPDEYRVSPRRLAEIHWRIGLINIARRKFEKAATALAAAIAIQQKLLAADPNDLEIKARLASNLNTAGVVYDDLRQRGKAESSYQAAQRHYRQLAERQPDEAMHRIGIAHTLSNLADLLSDRQDRLDEAEQLIRDARKQYAAVAKDLRRLGEEFNSLTTDSLLADVLRKQKKYVEATKLATAALGRCESRLRFAGDDRDGRELQADLHGVLAVILIAQEQYQKAEPHLRRQLQVLIKLLAAQRDPYTFSADMFFRTDPALSGKEQPERWGEWVDINLRLARVLRKTGQHRRAEIVLGPTLSVAGYLSFGYREVLKYRVMAANAHAEAALLLAGRWPDESRSQLIKAVQAWRWAAKDFDAAARHNSGLHGNEPDSVWFVAAFGEFDFTDPAKQDAIDKAIAEKPKRTNVLPDRARALYFAGYKNWKGSVGDFQKIIKQRNGSDAFDRFNLAIGLAKTGKTEESRSWFNRGVEWMEQNKGSEDEELVKLQGEAKKATIEK